MEEVLVYNIIPYNATKHPHSWKRYLYNNIIPQSTTHILRRGTYITILYHKTQPTFMEDVFIYLTPNQYDTKNTTRIHRTGNYITPQTLLIHGRGTSITLYIYVNTDANCCNKYCKLFCVFIGSVSQEPGGYVFVSINLDNDTLYDCCCETLLTML